MDRKDLDEIHRFLQSMGKADLYAYYGVGADCSLPELDGLIKKRRKWAQGQQSNPKFKSEALFLIKNNGAITKLLTEDGAAYRESLKSAEGPLEALANHVRRTVRDGVLSPPEEAGLVAKGRELGLTDSVIHQQIARLMNELGTRQEGPNELSGDSLAVDHYQVLGISPDATAQQIDEAYREKFRWARNLKDTRQAGEIMSALDDASRTLKDPERRRNYDARRRELDALGEIDNNTGIFDVSKHGLAQNVRRALDTTRMANPQPRGRLDVSDGYVDPRLLEGLPRPDSLPEGRDPFADRERPQEKVLVPDDEDTIVRDPFGPGGSLNPIVTWKPEDLPPEPEEPELPGAVSVTRPDQPPTPNIQAPTLGVSDTPQTVRTQVPHLTVEGPTRYSLENPQSPTTIQVKIRNEGFGRMPGRITVRGDWVELSRNTLDPDASDQTVILTIQPSMVPPGSSIATVRIAGDHGEVRDITVQVNRPEGLRSRRNLVVLGVAGLVAVLGVVAFLAFGGTKAGPPVALTLKVVPYADLLTIQNSDGTRQEATGEMASLTRPSNASSVVEVTTAGFQKIRLEIPASETSVAKDILLSPDIAMDHGPPPNRDPNVYEPDVEGVVRSKAAALGDCFRGGGTVRPRFSTWIADSGFVMWVDMDRASKERADLACVNRIFRGMRFTDMNGKNRDAVVSTSGIDLPARP